jgi:hypothetical protein
VENWNTVGKPSACGTQRRSERIAAATAAAAADADARNKDDGDDINAMTEASIRRHKPV